MDFAKAFDNVPHRRLLQRLLNKFDYYGIRGSTHKWINSWLSGRTQYVVLGGQALNPVPVLSGVPRVGFKTDPVPYFYKRLAGYHQVFCSRTIVSFIGTYIQLRTV